ncbi:unnamed protein product, partial [Schistosoma curassoni]|uniref:Kaptin n=1 Tax=Schistosoma curassoni TaxID=6186 RepID=A0A183KQ63_9TREM
NVFEQVEIDQDTKNSELNQSQTCHSSAAYGELSFNIAVVLFPELTKLPTTLIFLHMDFKIINNIRFSAFGSQDGWFGLFAVDMKSRRTIRHFYLSHESPITSIKIFQQFNGFDSASEEVIKDNEIDDFNLDGKTEIILGTFGQRLLYYEWELNNTDQKNGQFILKFQRSLPGPVFCISPALDLIGEGPLSLAVLTSRGLHIFQHDTYCLIKEIHHRLDNHSPLIINL